MGTAPELDDPVSLLRRGLSRLGGRLPRQRLVRLGYQIQQHGLALALMPALRAWHRVMEPALGGPDAASLERLRLAHEKLLTRDVDNSEAGYYGAGLLFGLPYLGYARRVPETLSELVRITWRRHRDAFDELPADELADYPDYYKRTFHWQTDGWLSERSARLYDPGVELLFFGTADVMRRMAIPPLVRAVRGVRRARVLDVACGTGRFLAQLRAALPEARLFGLDLSPHYLDYARHELKGLGVSLVADNAEAMPFADASFDAVTSVFLFHELPADARRNVVREARRVLKPGGMLVVCDAAQPPDSRELGCFFDNFTRLYHEPYFKSYQRDDLGDLLAECGFSVTSSETHLFSRVVAAVA